MTAPRPSLPALIGAAVCARFSPALVLAVLLLAPSFLAAPAALSQRRPMDVPDTTRVDTAPARTRLILRDGSYQLVLSYRVVGRIVRYRSAERNGVEEELPLELVDLPATEAWKQAHAPGAAEKRAQQPPVLSPELARQEAARAALTPEVAPDLHLPEEDSVLAMDTFRGTPELVPLPQSGSDLNKETAHAVAKGAINPSSSPHRIADIPRDRADIQLHVPDPVFFVRLNTGDDPELTGGGSFTVDTHGNSGRSTPSGGDPGSLYVIQRVDVRVDSRVIESFRIGQLGSGRPQRDLIETRADPLPGGHWLKLTPVQPLDFGEYALIEVLGANAVNLAVWDFGIHSDAPENVEAIHPEPKRVPSLERRRP
ncbi:MAG TPA: hypothetical protein VM865_04000 [Acidobacteriaceae bacterium]|nr:hypothetical protein [Acidobacteriaceae bacterium]